MGCDCMAIGRSGGKTLLCRVQVLPAYIKSLSYHNWVGIGEIPVSEIQDTVKFFTPFKHCPKCGTKHDFEEIAEKAFLLVVEE